MFMTLTTTILIIVILTCLLTGIWRGNRLPILMYHKVRPESGDAWTVTLEDFQSHLKILNAQGYQSISFRQLFDPSSTLPPKPILLTFDDAYADFEAHPLAAMEQWGFASTVFLPVGHVGGENAWDGGGEPIMNWDDVRRLSAGNTEFGLHSYNHGNYQDLTLDEMRTRPAPVHDNAGRAASPLSEGTCLPLWWVSSHGANAIRNESTIQITWTQWGGSHRLSYRTDAPEAPLRTETSHHAAWRSLDTVSAETAAGENKTVNLNPLTRAPRDPHRGRGVPWLNPLQY